MRTVDNVIADIKGLATALACCPNGLNSTIGQQQLTDLAALIVEAQSLSAAP